MTCTRSAWSLLAVGWVGGLDDSAGWERLSSACLHIWWVAFFSKLVEVMSPGGVGWVWQKWRGGRGPINIEAAILTFVL